MEGKPNQLYAQGMRSFEQYDEVCKYFAEGKQRDNDANEIQKHFQLYNLSLGTDHYFFTGGGGHQKLLKKLFAQIKRVKKIVCLKFSGKKIVCKEISTTHILRKKQNINFNFIIHLT